MFRDKSVPTGVFLFVIADGESRVEKQAAHEIDVAVDEREARGEDRLPTRRKREP